MYQTYANSKLCEFIYQCRAEAVHESFFEHCLLLGIVVAEVVRFPNCHECQLGFQCPKKWELWKQWPILEENSIATATYWDKLTSYMSHKAISATKNLQLSRLLSWKTKHVFLPILISAGGHFQQLDLFTK